MKKAVFTVLGIALPLVVALLIEGALRFAGVGEARRHPFRPIPGKDSYVALDPDFGALFFRGFRPGVAFDPMARDKPPGTLRVVTLGGSTTAGFPYHWYYGFPGRLEDRLAAALPARGIEVANLGMTATNSYTVRTLAPSVVELKPDAIVIYSGHNEFYGAYGTAGTQGWTSGSIPFKRFLIAASRWALVSGLSSLIEDDQLPPGQRRTLMARVVREASIDRDSDTYRSGVEQFESNLRDALHKFELARIPVFLGTLTSNLSGQPPLGDEPTALEAFERGQDQLTQGDTSAARTSFMAAKEADGLRFRAPEDINEVVRRLADEFANVTLVDVQRQFRDASPDGLEGASLFTDHLHPNARGYALMADAFFDSMHNALPDLRGSALPGPSSSDLDPIELNHEHIQIAILTNGYPFRKDRTPAEAEAAARAEVERMYRSGRYAEELTARTILEGLSMANALNDAASKADDDADTLAALQSYWALMHWQPFNQSIIDRAVGYALENPNFDRQTGALTRYAVIHTGSLFSINAGAVVAIRRGELDQATALLTAAERLDPESPEMLFNRARVFVMQSDTLHAREYFERYRAIAHK